MISTKARDLILSYEGLGQPGDWPRGDSGITIGYGYDLGYVTQYEFFHDWNLHLDSKTLIRLSEAVGLQGIEARNIAYKFADIYISHEAAIQVFDNSTLPKYIQRTRLAFPGFEVLPLDTQGALVSLVYNRGGSMEGDRRREMRAIREAVKVGSLKEIVYELRSMKRLWVGKGLDGLLKRRDAEAALVESCIGVEANGTTA